MFPQTS